MTAPITALGFLMLVNDRVAALEAAGLRVTVDKYVVGPNGTGFDATIDPDSSIVVQIATSTGATLTLTYSPDEAVAAWETATEWFDAQQAQRALAAQHETRLFFSDEVKQVLKDAFVGMIKDRLDEKSTLETLILPPDAKLEWIGAPVTQKDKP